MAIGEERKQAIKDLRDLLRQYNGIILGDKGILKAYRKFLRDNKVRIEPPTPEQADWVRLMGSAVPLMEPNINVPRPKAD